MKGIILAGGSGTRLYPLTNFTSKQLLPIFDKPTVYYPLSTLMLSGIRDIAIVSTPRDLPNYINLLGDGTDWGLTISYFEQKEPKGIAEAFIICEEFIGKSSVTLILGDNIFYGNLRLDDIFGDFKSGSLIFGYSVKNPENFGIINFKKDGTIHSLEEKPTNPKSNFAIPGFYIYDNKVIKYSKELKPSDRGELEITDINKRYLKEGNLRIQIMGRGIAWIDTGTAASLQKAGSFIQSVEEKQKYKISCPFFIRWKRYLRYIFQ